MKKLRILGHKAELVTCFMLASYFACSSTLNIEVKISSETSVHFQRATWCYILENRTPNSRRCEDLKPKKLR
jgi:hypothetical protein